MEYQTITNLLDTTSDLIMYRELLLKNGQKFIISQVVLKIDVNQANK